MHALPRVLPATWAMDATHTVPGSQISPAATSHFAYGRRLPNAAAQTPLVQVSPALHALPAQHDCPVAPHPGAAPTGRHTEVVVPGMRAHCVVATQSTLDTQVW